MTIKTILEAALKLPPQSRAQIAGKLLDSLGDSVWEETLRAGAKIAESRLRDLRAGKTRGISEADAHRLIFGKE